MLQLHMHVFWPALLAVVIYAISSIHFSIKLRQNKIEEAILIYAYTHLGFIVAILIAAVIINF